jgi:hypothetical protein
MIQNAKGGQMSPTVALLASFEEGRPSLKGAIKIPKRAIIIQRGPRCGPSRARQTHRQRRGMSRPVHITPGRRPPDSDTWAIESEEHLRKETARTCLSNKTNAQSNLCC